MHTQVEDPETGYLESYAEVCFSLHGWKFWTFEKASNLRTMLTIRKAVGKAHSTSYIQLDSLDLLEYALYALQTSFTI